MRKLIQGTLAVLAGVALAAGTVGLAAGPASAVAGDPVTLGTPCSQSAQGGDLEYPVTNNTAAPVVVQMSMPPKEYGPPAITVAPGATGQAQVYLNGTGSQVIEVWVDGVLFKTIEPLPDRNETPVCGTEATDFALESLCRPSVSQVQLRVMNRTDRAWDLTLRKTSGELINEQIIPAAASPTEPNYLYYERAWLGAGDTWTLKLAGRTYVNVTDVDPLCGEPTPTTPAEPSPPAEPDPTPTTEPDPTTTASPAPEPTDTASPTPTTEPTASPEPSVSTSPAANELPVTGTRLAFYGICAVGGGVALLVGLLLFRRRQDRFQA